MSIIVISQAITGIFVIILILLQDRSTGAGGAFGGGGGGGGGDFLQRRRGVEKILFIATIILVSLFTILSILNLVL